MTSSDVALSIMVIALFLYWGWEKYWDSKVEIEALKEERKNKISEGVEDADD